MTTLRKRPLAPSTTVTILPSWAPLVSWRAAALCPKIGPLHWQRRLQLQCMACFSLPLVSSLNIVCVPPLLPPSWPANFDPLRPQGKLVLVNIFSVKARWSLKVPGSADPRRGGRGVRKPESLAFSVEPPPRGWGSGGPLGLGPPRSARKTVANAAIANLPLDWQFY